MVTGCGIVILPIQIRQSKVRCECREPRKHNLPVVDPKEQRPVEPAVNQYERHRHVGNCGHSELCTGATAGEIEVSLFVQLQDLHFMPFHVGFVRKH